MGGGKGKKRKHSQFVQGQADRKSNIGIGATLTHVRDEEPPASQTKATESSSTQEEWITVGKAGKKQKQKQTNYPSLGYSELHRLNQCVNINGLQGLVLYCLADGTSQQWVSVKHHHMVRRAVILFVPGLEKGMFDGSIELDPSKDDASVPKQVDGQAASTEGIEVPLKQLPRRTQLPNPFLDDTGDGPAISANNSDQVATPSHVAKNHTELIADSTAEPAKSSLPSFKPYFKSPDDYLPAQLTPETLPTPLKPLAETFKHLWPVKAPGDEKYGKVHSPIHAMLNSPLTKTEDEKRENKRITGPRPPREGKSWENKRTPITHFLSSKEELEDNEYVLHPAWFSTSEEKGYDSQRRAAEKQTLEDGWIDTAIQTIEEGIVADEDVQKGSITVGREIVAMDCEMCRVEGGDMALTRISLVEWDGTVLMDDFVKPSRSIIDYLTPYSGITPAKLECVTTTLADIQKRLMSIITPKHILVGHSLNADLSALKTTHPFVVDTSILYPHPRGPPMKSSLKWLAQKYLGREIQKGHGTMGHDSVEDARACLDLVKMKCERGPQWGTSEATSESIFKRLKRVAKAGSDNGKTGAIIDHGQPEKNFGGMASFCIGCTTDTEIVAGIKRAVLGDSDGSYIPGGGVDFTWARFQELASARGWLADYRHYNNPSSQNATDTEAASNPSLATVVTKTVQHIKAVRDFLPPCTLLLVYSGTGDPREMARLQDVQRTFKREYQTKKWDQLSVKWTDTEEQALKAACKKAREGIGLVTIV